MENTRIKKLFDYDITTLNYIQDTLVMLNEVYGATHISRDRDDILALHKEYPQKSPYGHGYSRAAAVYKHVRLSNFLSGVESGLGFRFPIEWEESDPSCGVLKIERLIYDIRKEIELKGCSSGLVYSRLQDLSNEKLRVLYTLVSEYERLGYGYVTSFYNGAQVAFWSAEPYKDKDGRWTSKGDARVFENIDGLLFYTDWPVRKEDDNFVHVSEILQAIIKLDEERNGTIFSKHSFRQAVDKTFVLEADIQAAIDKYRRELEMFSRKSNEDIARAAEIIYKHFGVRENN